MSGRATGPDGLAMLGALLDDAPCGFLSFADDGRIRAVNATLLRMLGHAREELVGRHVETILGVGSRIFYQTHLFPMVRLHGVAEEIFLLLRDRAGGSVGVLANLVRRERSGEWATDCAVMRVRERQKYEDELLRARRAADEARREAEARADALRLANQRLEEQAEELELQQQLLQEQASELEAASEELHTMNDHLLERSEELERTRAAAEEANRAKSNFLAAMSHELRTPLNAIAGYVQLLEMGIHGPVTAAQTEALGRIERSQRHLLRLINDVLNLARIEAGRVDYRVEDAPVAELVAEVVPMVEPQLATRGLTLSVETADAPWVRCDREKVTQILLNLLGNAVKFTPRGGRVRVDVPARAETGDRVYLRVSDTGIGIPAEKLESIFEPFVQVDVSERGRAEGTGLGLAISRDLARGMGGELRARSAPGEGSTFTLALPRAEEPEESA